MRSARYSFHWSGPPEGATLAIRRTRMTVETPNRVMKQHLIDPEICIRCNTCEETCPIDAITHDSNNYVVDSEICNHCMACVPPCPTGAIDNWIRVIAADAYSLEDQFGWDE